ncbi:MAG: AEC family transporter [Clostridia bacterium]|nr:AEC family transporter [Clostridia bacterium]
MNVFTALNESLLLFLFVILGYLLARFRFIGEVKSMSSIVVNVALPAVLIRALFSQRFDPAFLPEILLCVGAAIVVYALALFISVLLLSSSKKESTIKRTAQNCICFGNTSFLGFPLISALLGDEVLYYAAFFVITQNLILYSVGYGLLGGKISWRSVAKTALSPGMILVYVATVLSFCGVTLTGMAYSFVDKLADLAIPISLIVVGYYFSQNRFSELVRDPMGYVVALGKNILLPLMTVGLVLLLPISPVMRCIITIESAVPVMAAATSSAENLGGHPLTASNGTMMSMTVGLATIPAVTWLCSVLFGL